MKLMSETLTLDPIMHGKFKGNARDLVEGLIKSGLTKEQNRNSRGHHEILSPNQLTPLESQRNATEAWVRKVLKLSDGFDRMAAGVLQIARTPTGENLVWDGCGRLALAQATNITDLDCWVSNMSAEDAAHYFVYVQKTSNRSLKPGELFINGYHTGAREYLEFAETLTRLGMRIQGADDYWVPRVSLEDRIKYPKVRERSVRLALKYAGYKTEEIRDKALSKQHKDAIDQMSDEHFVRFARDTIVQSGWNDDNIRQDLLPGLVLVYKCYPELLVNGYNNSLRGFFRALAGTVKQEKLQFKQHGGNKHNREIESVAVGIIKDFRASPSAKTAQKGIITQSRIDEFVRRLANDEADSTEFDDE